MNWLPFFALVLYGALHSLLAARPLKNRIRNIIGERRFEGFYRLAYNVIAALTFVPVALVMLLMPSRVLWEIPMPWAFGAMLLQVVGVVGLVAAVLQADPLRFAGIKQAIAYFNGDPLPLPPEPLQTSGFYGLVRHPLYFFSLLFLWPTPVMTDAYLSFAFGATLYFIVGSLLEERRLLREFETYATYRQRVPWLLPWPRRRSAAPKQG
ncbi:MAG: isoprenylcysteine carboxylmethyltransferase family protein [Anaerolineae bacterium]